MGKLGGVQKLKMIYLVFNIIPKTRMSTGMWKVTAILVRDQVEQGLYGKLVPKTFNHSEYKNDVQTNLAEETSSYPIIHATEWKMLVAYR